jgi:hypothetical protein
MSLAFMAEPLAIVFLDDDGTPLPTFAEADKWYRDDDAARFAVAEGRAMLLSSKPTGRKAG